MMHKGLIAVLGIIVAASPVAASQPDLTPATGAPPGTPDTRYCLRVEPFTGSRIETTSMLDPRRMGRAMASMSTQEWAEEGVRVIG